MKKLIGFTLALLLGLAPMGYAANVQMDALTDGTTTVASTWYLIGYNATTPYRFTIASVFGLRIALPTTALINSVFVTDGSTANTMTSIAGGGTGGILGWNTAGVLGKYTIMQLDDSAAQFYSATASKGTWKMLMTSMGSGILGTFTPVCTGTCILTTPSLGAGTYTHGLLEVAGTWSGQQTFVAPVLGTPASGNASNLTNFPTLNQDTTGSAVYLKSGATTGKIGITGPTTGQTRTWTIPDADVTIPANPADKGANAFTGAQTFTGSGGLTSPPITTDIRAVTFGAATIGTTALPFSHFYMGAPGGTYYFDITGTPGTSHKTITMPNVTGTVVVATESTTTTQAMFATATTGAPAFRAIADADLPKSITGMTITGASLIATGIVDGLTNVTICTDGTETANPAGKMSQIIVNKHATAATALTVTMATPVAGMQLIVKNGQGAGGTNTGVITMIAGTDVIIYNPTTKVNCTATQNLVSGGAAGDYVALVAMDTTHWESVGSQGTWACATP